ncbi:hypothetical protein Tco_0341391 [Tanacetum coccineum]
MSTPVFVDLEISTQADGAQSSRVPYEAIRQAYLVETDTKSEPFESPIESETHESPHIVASPTLLPDSSPPACHAEELEDSDTSGARSMSSDSTAPLSPDHPHTPTSPTPTPTRASFHRMTTRMTVRAQPVMSPGHSARVTEAMALLDSAFRKRYGSSYETPSPSPTLLVRKRYRGTPEPILNTDSEEDEIREEDTNEDGGDESSDVEDEGHGLDSEDHGLDNKGRSVESNVLGLEEEEAVPEGQQRAVLVVETSMSEPLELGYGALRRRELAAEEDQVHSTFEVGQGSGSVPEPKRPETYIDIPAYPPPAPLVQTPPSLEWSSGSLPISPTPSTVPSPISSSMISLTVPSPIASPVATPTATISIDRDVRELYTRSGAVRDEIFSQRYRLRSQEHEQERTTVTFGALWRPVLALEAWARHVDTRLADTSRDRYDDHRLIRDMLVQQAAMQREL